MHSNISKSVTFEAERKPSSAYDYSRHFQVKLYISQNVIIIIMYKTNWVEKKDLKRLEKVVNEGKPLRSADKDREVAQGKKYREVIAREKKEIERQAKEVKEERIQNKRKSVEFTPVLPKYDGKHETIKPHDVMFLLQKPQNRPAPKILKTAKRPMGVKTDAFFANVPRNNVRTRTYYKTAADVPFVPFVSAKSLRSRPASSALARSIQVSPTPHLLGSRRRSLCSACAERPESPKTATSEIPLEHSLRLKSTSPLSSYYANVPPKIALLRSILPSESSKLLKVSKREAYMSLCPPFIARKFISMKAREDNCSISDSTTTSDITLESLEIGSTICTDMSSETNTTEPTLLDHEYIHSNSSTVDGETIIEKNLADDENEGEIRRKENVLYTQCDNFQYLDSSHIPMKYSKTVRKGNDSMIVTLTVSSVSYR